MNAYVHVQQWKVEAQKFKFETGLQEQVIM